MAATNPQARTDAELIVAVRNGDETAFAELYARHRTSARRLAWSYRRADDPDDLVHEAFELILTAINRGAGPREAFRAYLLVTLRRLAINRLVRARDEPVDEVPEPETAAQLSTTLDPVDRQIVVSAYESLPDRSREVLWRSTVEGRQPRELAAAFGVSANAAAALAYRAREKLRQAYLQAHVHAAPRPECEPHRSRLGGYVRDGLGRGDQVATGNHVDDCAPCTALVSELRGINHMLVRAVRPNRAAAPSATTTAGESTTPAPSRWCGIWIRARIRWAAVAGAAITAAVVFRVA